MLRFNLNRFRWLSRKNRDVLDEIESLRLKKQKLELLKEIEELRVGTEDVIKNEDPMERITNSASF